MKIVITGAGGQLGWELQRCVPPRVEIVALKSADLDIGDAAAVTAKIAELKPDWIINAAAYTAVDKAEEELELARRVNATGVKNLATAAQANGARLLHVSTDFVFDGSHSSPYRPEHPVKPLGAYGLSKLEGEQAVAEVLGDDTLVVRTAWVYSAHGGNFVKTMLRLMNDRDELGVIDDQIGTPTWAAELARVLYLAIEKDLRGTYHWTDSGVASWYDLAYATYEIARENGWLTKDVTIRPIPTEAYPLPAERPAYSVLDKNALREATGYNGLHWRIALKNMLKDLHNV